MSLEAVVKALAEKAQQKELEEYKKAVSDNLTKAMSGVFSEAQRYTNIVIIAGYAAFFTMWGSMKTALPENATLWAALFMTVSAGLFVAFETYKMIVNSSSLTKLTPVLKQPPDKFKAALEAYQVTAAQDNLQFYKVWIVSLVLICTTGYAGWGILVWHFIAKLFSLPHL